MTLNITRGKQRQGERILVDGEPGIGKTAFAVGAEAPLWQARDGVLVADAEDGASYLNARCVDFKRGSKGWAHSLEMLREMCEGTGDHDTVAVDTADALEQQCVAQVCADGIGKGSVKSIANLGYDGSNTLLPGKWRELLFTLDSARNKGRHVILVCHLRRSTVKDPSLPSDYHTLTGNMHEKIWGPTMQWADNILHARYEQTSKEGRVYMLSDKRVLKTQKDAGWEAKNRLQLPSELPLSWKEFARYLRKPEEVRKAILEAAVGDLQAKAKERCDDAGESVARLCAIETALRKKIEGESNGEGK